MSVTSNTPMSSLGQGQGWLPPLPGSQVTLLADDELDPMEYRRLCLEGTGRIEGESDFLHRRKSKNHILEASHFIARQLCAHGIPAYKAGQWIFRVGAGSGQVEAIPQFIDSNIIPSVASRNRRKMLLNLEHFISMSPCSRFEMWTFTSGIRCDLGNLRTTCCQLARDISRLNGESFLRDYGVEFQFRSTELGSLNMDEGHPTFHLHAHLIVKLNRDLDGEARASLRSQIYRRWRHYWNDCDGRDIRDPRQACQYMVKIQDLQKLRSPEIAELYHQLKGLRLVEAMGEFRLMANELAGRNLKIVRRNGQLHRVRKSIRRSSRAAPRPEPLEPIENLVLYKTLPIPAFSRVAEPCFIILNFNPCTFKDNQDCRSLALMCSARFEVGLRALQEGDPP